MEVEALWDEMRKEKAPGALASLGRKKPAAKGKAKAKGKQLDSTMGWAASWGVSARVREKSVERPVAMEVLEPPQTQLDSYVQEETVVWTPDSFMSAVARDVNLLAEGSVQVRLESLQKLQKVVTVSLPTDVLDAAIDLLLKPLLKRVSDPSERSREIAVSIVIALLEGVSDHEFSTCLPYVMPVLVSRMACEDIDGIAHLPEVMRPKPEQRPTLHHAVETSEEVRLLLAQLMRTLLNRLAPFQQMLITYIDEVVGVCRAHAMDPFAGVKALACENVELLCHHHHEMLPHFTLALGRSLCSGLVHNHAKIKIAALRALTAVFKCGVWKQNHEVVQHLIAWQDPNLVPVKAFYDPVASTTVNYFSSLTFAQTPSVRRFWFETLAYWLLRVEDKVDHEPHIFPYLLSGLFDENDEIALETFWLMERVGEMYEQENEKDLRDERQYGWDLTWTYNGRGFCPFPACGQWKLRGEKGVPLSPYRQRPQGPDHTGTRAQDRAREAELDLGEPLEIPGRSYSWPLFRDLEVFPVLPRPRLGARHYVRKHTRRYIKALFNNVVDFRDCTALNAAQLLCLTIAYCEEGVTEWVRDIDNTMVRFYAGKAAMGRTPELVEVFDRCCAQLGAFLDAKALWEQAKDAFDPASPLAMAERVATVEIYARQLRGAVVVLGSLDDPSVKWGHLTPVLPEVLDKFQNSDLLFEAPSATRSVLWQLLLELLVPELRPYYTAEQVTQLLCLGVTIAASPPPQLRADLLALQPNVQDVLHAAQWADASMLEELYALLAQIPAAPAADGAGLLQAGFLAMLEFADFPSFRALAEIAPLPVLLVPEHRTRFLDLLEGHSATGNQSGTRVLALGIVSRLVQRCAEAGTPEASSLADEALSRTVPPVLTGMQTLLPVLVPRPEPEEEDEMDGVLVEEVPRAEELALDEEVLKPTPVLVPGAVFAPAAGFEGSRPGYVFKMGARGLGYYKDGVPEDAEDALDMDALDDDEPFCPPPRGRAAPADDDLDALDAEPGVSLDMDELDDEPGVALGEKAAVPGEEQPTSQTAEAKLMEMDAENAAADKLAAMESALCSAAPKADPDAYPSNALGPEEEDGDVERLPLLVAATPYVVLVSAVAVLHQSMAAASPKGFLRPANWWAPLVTLAGDASLHVRLRAALERSERAVRGLDLKADLTVKTFMNLRMEADRRADRVRCTALATLLCAGNREDWPADLVDGLRPLFAALAPNVDQTPDEFKEGQNFFLRSLPPAVALYLAAVLRHTVAPKFRGATTMRDDAPRAIARLDMKRTAVSRLRGAKWEPAEQTEAHVKTMEALAELNLTLPPDPETPNKPTESAGQILGEAVAGQSLIPSEVERVLAEKDDALRWNAALALMELQIELVRQFTVPAIELHKEWSDAGMHGRVLLLDDIIRRSVSLPGSNEKKSTYTGA